MSEAKGHIGFAMCGSFCTLERSLKVMQELAGQGWRITPLMSDMVYQCDTRFGTANSFRERVTEICGDDIIHTIVDAEPLGPKLHLDALVILPCTGNTLAKMAQGITDSTVTMAAKAQLRSNRPVVVGLASNDALSANLRNIGMMLSRKQVFFVPLFQDDPLSKPHSLICRFELTPKTLDYALNAKQLQPLLQ